jgi:hypothetical protein
MYPHANQFAPFHATDIKEPVVKRLFPDVEGIQPLPS